MMRADGGYSKPRQVCPLRLKDAKVAGRGQKIGHRYTHAKGWRDAPRPLMHSLLRRVETRPRFFIRGQGEG